MSMPTQLLRNAQFLDIYSNNSAISLTPYDASLIFSRMSTFGGNNFVEELATVRMSPQQLVLLARSLTTAAEAWQAEFGAVDVSSTPAMSVETMRAGLQGAKQAMQQNMGLMGNPV